MRADRQDGSRRQLRRTDVKARRARGSEVWDAAKKANPNLPDDLRIHKPYIDEIIYDSPFAKGARHARVPEVIDCWYDAGSMPFAQWGYPASRGQRRDSSKHQQFPADFISEAIDQTRGWFYSQLAISTLLFGESREQDERPNEESTIDVSPLVTRPFPYPHPFRNCIVLGLMLGEDGQKMSKSKRNYREPDEIFDSTAPTPCAGTSSPTSRRGPRSATTNRQSKTASPSSCCGSGTSIASS